MTASTGDSGYGVGYPATSTHTVAVGGTSLYLDANNTRASETAWSGAGSGCSTYQAQPAWQASLVGGACGTNRAIADVSAVADPNTGVAVYDSFTYQGASGWLQFGGTSVSAPIIAAIYALAKGEGASWTGNPASALYSNYSATALYDVTSGSNGSCSPLVLCRGSVGWDGPTGLGTPNGLAAFGGGGGGTTTVPTAGFTSSCTDLACSFTDTSTDVGGTVTGWSWAFGDDGTSTSANPSHTYGAGGTYTVTLTVTDSAYNTSSVGHSVTVSAGTGTVPVITAKSCAGAPCTFTATGTGPLTWNFGATGSPVEATFSSPGGYTVTVTNSVGSASTSVSCGWNGHGRNKTLSCS